MRKDNVVRRGKFGGRQVWVVQSVAVGGSGETSLSAWKNWNRDVFESGGEVDGRRITENRHFLTAISMRSDGFYHYLESS